MTPRLRDYQGAMVEQVRAAYRSGSRAVLLAAPTGSGKTVIFSHVAAGAAAKGGRVLILVHRQELLRQTAGTLCTFGVAHGLIAPGQPTTGHAVQVASVPTLVRRLARLDWEPTLIVVDEAHHATRTTGHGRILAQWPAAAILGVTATPTRLDGQGLGVQAKGFFEHLVVGPSVADLIAAGYLARPLVYAPPGGADLTGVKVRAGDWAREALEAAVDRPRLTGDAVDHYRRLGHGAPAIAFCVSVAHAVHVAEAFRAEGYQAASIDGALSDQERAARIRDLGTGALQVLTSCDLISEGTDIPIVGAALLLRPTLSQALYLQQVGRVLRPAPGKTEAIILDHVGNCHRHGLPDEPREWTLEGRIKRQGPTPFPIRQCEQCYTVHRPAPVCPACGFAYPVQARELEAVDGELTKVDPVWLRAVRDRAAKQAEQGQARTLEELRRLAAARGYRQGWAERVYAARRGR